jgi:phenylalanyl-tRNA synthetase beta chain
MISGAMIKSGRGDIWEKESSVDIYDIKGVFESILVDLKIKDWNITYEEHPSLHPLRSGKISVEGERLGIFGEIHPEVLSNYRISGKVFIFEIELDKLQQFIPLDVKYRALPKYPSILRDMAMVVKNEVLSIDVINTIKSVDKDLIKKVILFDVFKGASIGEGNKSLAYSIIFQAEDRTLTDNEVDEINRKIRAILSRKYNAKMRE